MSRTRPWIRRFDGLDFGFEPSLKACALSFGIGALLAVSGCSSDGGSQGSAGSAGTVAGQGSGGGGTGGAGANGGSTTGGAGASAGMSGATGVAGAAGSGGSAGAAGAAGSSGSAGASGASGAGGTGGIGGTAGSAGAGGSGGAKNCAGNAVSFTSNVPANGDPAKSRVMVDFGTSTDLPLLSTPRTLELWAFIKSTSWAPDANTLFEYGDQSKTNAGFGFDFGGTVGTIDPYTNGTLDNDNQPSGLANANMDQWVHIAMTWDGTTVRAFINGTQRAMKTAPAPNNMLATARTALTIGGNPRGAYFNGSVDEFRLWNVARTAAEISGAMGRTLVGNEAGLVGYWKFDDAAGSTTAMDSTTTAGHMAHNAMLMATSMPQLPVFVASTAPITCP